LPKPSNFSRGSLFEECFFASFFSKKRRACPARARKIGKTKPNAKKQNNNKK
jgi:hypothetical protein